MARRVEAYKSHLRELRAAVDRADKDDIVEYVEYALEENPPEDKVVLEEMLNAAADSARVDALLRPIEMRLGLRAPEPAVPRDDVPGEGGRRRRRKTRKGKSRKSRRSVRK